MGGWRREGNIGRREGCESNVKFVALLRFEEMNGRGKVSVK